MLVDQWVEQVWQVLTIRKKTLQDYRNLYRRHLQPVIGHMEIDSVASKDLQIKLISLPPYSYPRTVFVLRSTLLPLPR